MMLTGTKRNVHNIVDNHISTERRTGRDLRDAYYHRSKYLLKKAQELESITGCIVNLEITPTWEKGVKKCYHSKGYEPDFNLSTVSSQSHFDTSTDDVTHKTPEKKRKSKKEESANLNSANVCRICGIVWESIQDEESDSFWIGCAGKSCKCKRDCHHEYNWWVHNRCAHIFYNTDFGERNLANWAKKHLFCPLHMPVATKVGWDQEQQKDVVVEATNCKSKRFLKKAIANKLQK